MLLARRAMMGKKGGLPSAYQQVEWIGADGTQYINTGVLPTLNTGFELVSDDDGFSITNEKTRFGSRKANSNNALSFTTLSTGYIVALGSRTPKTITSSTPNIKTITYDPMTIKATAKRVNGETFETSFGPYSISEPYAIYLFALNQANTRTYCATDMKMSVAKLSENGEDVRNFIPCYRKSDNEIGMYDLCGSICPLTGTPFYINSGTGTFTKGADV